MNILLNIATALCWALAAYNIVNLIQHYRRSKRERTTMVEFVCRRCGERWLLPHDRKGDPLPEAVTASKQIHAHWQLHKLDEDRRHGAVGGTVQ